MKRPRIRSGVWKEYNFCGIRYTGKLVFSTEKRKAKLLAEIKS